MSAEQNPSTFLSRFRRGDSTFHDHWFSYFLVLPTVLFLVLILWFPFFRGIWMSLHDWPVVGTPEFVGLENYRFLFNWDVFYTSLYATTVFLTSTALQLGTAILAALLVARQEYFKNLISGTLLLPYTMPPVVTGTVWLFLLDPSYGPFQAWLVELGVLSSPIYWSIEGSTALAVITLVNSWTFWPFMFIIILATLENIPASYYESAQVYGANRFQTFRMITLPQLKSAIIVAVSIRFIWNIAKISQPIQMTKGGPGHATSVLGILLFRRVNNQGQLGLAFTIGLVMMAISLIFIALFIRQVRRDAAGGAAA